MIQLISLPSSERHSQILDFLVHLLPFMRWKIVDTGMRCASANMELDAALLEDLSEEPILHLYDWEGKAATYGHFLDPSKLLNMRGVKEVGLSLAKRPTGGGVVFHVTDLAFSVLLPATHPAFSQNTLENYAFVNNRVLEAIEAFGGVRGTLLPTEEGQVDVTPQFCMAKPTKYDVMLGDKKVGGAAQRKTRQGFLHQGSIYLGAVPSSILERVLGKESPVIPMMQRHSLPLLGMASSEKELLDARKTLTDCLQKVFLCSGF